MVKGPLLRTPYQGSEFAAIVYGGMEDNQQTNGTQKRHVRTILLIVAPGCQLRSTEELSPPSSGDTFLSRPVSARETVSWLKGTVLSWFIHFRQAKSYSPE
jgi:hypothetical protein